MPVFVYEFDATLEGFDDVRRTLAICSDQTLEQLHAAIQQAFDWHDDHLYAFWLGGRYWEGEQYVHPFALDGPAGFRRIRQRSAAVRLSKLALRRGQRIAYVFDFGDEWRVRLTLVRISAPDGEPYPRIVDSIGEAPPQYEVIAGEEW